MSIRKFLFFLFWGILSEMFLMQYAYADVKCWTPSRLSFSFGTITPGDKIKINTPINFQCNNHSDTEMYVRICLSLANVSQPEMNMNSPVTPLYYNIYESEMPNESIKSGSNSSVEVMFRLESGTDNQTHLSYLLAQLVPGQTGIQAGKYFDYDVTGIIFNYSSNQNKELLPSCGAMAENSWITTVHADAVIKNGCDLLSVEPMNFGQKSPVDSLKLTGKSHSAVSLRCPSNTNYIVSMGMGLHNEGGGRRMCNNNDCVTYGLYQDAGYSIPWDNNRNTMNRTSVSNETESIIVYGYIPPQDWPSSGDYTDTVVVTLKY